LTSFAERAAMMRCARVPNPACGRRSHILMAAPVADLAAAAVVCARRAGRHDVTMSTPRTPVDYHSKPDMPARLRNTGLTTGEEAAVDIEQLRRDGFALRCALRSLLEVRNIHPQVDLPDLQRAMRAVETWDRHHA
jgi:hypothetical protein